MTSPHVASNPQPSVPLEHSRDTRARAWAFVFDCYRKKEAAPESRPDDAKERSKNDSSAGRKYTR